MIKRILYTADATTEGGREGHARTSDGRRENDDNLRPDSDVVAG
jgi:organic hydroperoxide reductase OsmC/OhrA